MTEILSKSSVFSPICQYNNNHNNKGQIFPVTCSISATNRGNFVGFSSLKSEFGGFRIAVVANNDALISSFKRKNSQSVDAKMGLSIGKAHKWWEKGLRPNMKEITSAEDLVDSLRNAGDKLVVVDFYSPGCGGCKALHPKICQFAEMNPDVQFLQVNYEEHKSMCYSLNVHVLPFFRFYRGAEGRVCSFSCTNATIKKFRDALAKHSPARCSFEPTKGLEEKELLALAANKDLSFTYTPKPVEPQLMPTHEEVLLRADSKSAGEALSPSETGLHYSPTTLKSSQDSEEKTLVAAGR